MPGHTDIPQDDSDLDSLIQSPLAQPEPIRGILWLLAAAALLSVSVGSLFRLFEEFDPSNEIVDLAAPVGVFFPILILIGFAFTIPLLWFQGLAKRCFYAVLVSTGLWGLLLGGFVPYQDFEMDGEGWLMASSLLLLGLVGAAIPLGLVMSLFRWRISVSGSTSLPVPVGIMDLMALTALGAGIFAFQRQWGPFADDSIDLLLAIIIVSFYGLVGSVVSACLLLVMRMFLGADGRPFCLPNLIGIAVTFALTAAAWALPVFSEDSLSVGKMHPVLLWLVLSTVTWVIAAATTFPVCWWLRRYGFCLNTAAIEKAKRSQLV